MAKNLTPEDEALWQAATYDISGQRRKAAAPQEIPTALGKTDTPRIPAPTQQKRAANPLPPLLPLDHRSTARRFNAHARIDAALDLHGFTQDQAHEALMDFLQRHIQRGSRHLEIITGKGRHGEGVLRRLVPLWLEQSPWRVHIAAISYAPEKKGGTGALHVLLKSPTTIADKPIHAR